MSDMFLCVDCGRIGDKNSLLFYEVSVPDNEIMNKIMGANHLGSFKCPGCGSSSVFYSKPEIPLVVPGPMVIPYAPVQKQPDDYTVFTTDKTVPSVPMQLSQEAAPEEVIAPPVEEAKPRPVVRHTNECDTCKKDFISKVAGATRCPECIKKTLKL